jgi:hypothetical protein
LEENLFNCVKKIKKVTSAFLNFSWRRFSEKIKAFKVSRPFVFTPVFVFIPAGPDQPGTAGRA